MTDGIVGALEYFRAFPQTRKIDQKTKPQIIFGKNLLVCFWLDVDPPRLVWSAELVVDVELFLLPSSLLSCLPGTGAGCELFVVTESMTKLDLFI